MILRRVLFSYLDGFDRMCDSKRVGVKSHQKGMILKIVLLNYFGDFDRICWNKPMTVKSQEN